ncbi:MAG: TonB-dependent receptor [Desulfobacteraceae bacterium]|nr:TonB-dependent receptor [Desulfobacteraceae bacterium]
MNNTRIIKFGFLNLLVIVTITILMTVDFSLAAVTRFTPSISISEEYTDNYNQTENNTETELSTEYLMGLEFEYIETKSEVSFNYNLSYIDYVDHDENDSWQHDFDFNSLLNLAKHTDLIFTESFLRSRNISQRTGTWGDNDTNSATIELVHQFGQRNSFELDFSYFLDKYDDPNIDEHTSYRPSAFLAYWFNVRYGFEVSAFYEQTEFDISKNEEDTLSGSIKLRRQITNHFQIYVEYEHSVSEDDFEEHNVYNPSVGFDWTISETSSISLGAGVLINRYDNQQDSEDFFVDLNAFKLFNLSRRATFSISASSGYGEISEDAASLGFRIYYQAGFDYNYELTRQVTLDISGSYLRDEFDEEQIDRNDNTFNLNAGVSWSPLNWMTLGLSYSYTNFKTDAAARDDYVENRGIFTITLTTPYRSQRIQQENTREIIEARIFQ